MCSLKSIEEKKMTKTEFNAEFIVMRSPLLQTPPFSHLGFLLLRIKEAGRSEAIS
jgi:hypothetical protein